MRACALVVSAGYGLVGTGVGPPMEPASHPIPIIYSTVQIKPQVFRDPISILHISYKEPVAGKTFPS